MLDLISKLFSSEFMPHGHCYFWQPTILWLHVGSDFLIAFSYYSIPLALVYLVRKREDLAFDWIFLMFAAFIFACGTTHLMNIWTVWHGTYGIEGVIKLFTGIVSAVTAVLLWRLMPKALELPSIETLKQEVQKREAVSMQLQQAHDSLEKRVEDRTAELLKSNEELKDKTDKLERFQAITLNRELDMIRLKKEINILCRELGKPPKYNTDDERPEGM